jgi:hypothetical protein
VLVEEWVFYFQDWCLENRPKGDLDQDFVERSCIYLRQTERVREAYEQGRKIGEGGGGRRHEPYHFGQRAMAWHAGWLVGNYRYCASRDAPRISPALKLTRWVIYPWEEKPWDEQGAYNRRYQRERINT